jgi:peptide/nickel transport system ATP-binding protein/oligopeptide transport system ATP-binding protein
MSEPLLDVQNLKMYFPIRKGVLMRQAGWVKAVDDVSLTIHPGETLGLVGESGCGKSTLGKCLVRLLNPSSGKVIFQGQDIAKISQRKMRPLRPHIQMVFQDPAESLNQRLSIGQIVAEPFVIHGIGTRAQQREWVLKLLDRVGLPHNAIDRFPFEFSGGQRQRIGIARALTLKPKLLILDEPVSALDVSIQSQVLNLLLDLQEERKLSYLFIAHDLAVVKHVSDRVAVMYLGKIVESADATTIYKAPRHAYTKALLSAIPEPDPTQRGNHIVLPGDVPSPIDPPLGSAFGHRINHPAYPDSIGLNLRPLEIAPGHWVAPDPCALSPEDLQLVRERNRSAKKPK